MEDSSGGSGTIDVGAHGGMPPGTAAGDRGVDVPCGNGALDKGEECDDGNSDSGDGCSKDCAAEAAWHCPVPGAGCEQCGNGITESSETCDDKNAQSGDGCSAE